MLESYIKLDQERHFLCQFIAKVNKVLVPEQADDSHTNLYFDPVSRRILGRWFQDTHGLRHIMTLHLASHKLECLDENYELITSTITEEKNAIEIAREFAQQLMNAGLLNEPLPLEMHYEIPDYPFAEDRFSRPLIAAAADWEHYRELCNTACSHLLGYLQTTGEIRIWPHHFDTGVYAEPNSRLGIGFGLAMSDEMVDEPYFYFGGYALQGNLIYENLPELEFGSWKITDGFKGAVLPFSEIENLRLEKSLRRINGFQEAVYKYLLGASS